MNVEQFLKYTFIGLAIIGVYSLITNNFPKNNNSTRSFLANKQRCQEAGEKYLKKLEEYTRSPIGDSSPNYLDITYAYNKSLDTCLISGNEFYSRQPASGSIAQLFVDDTLSGEPGRHLLYFDRKSSSGWEKDNSKLIKYEYEFENKRKALMEDN